jgi:aspartyl-tRNA(Asn)/glutamyl-tRNA(Gln) amidotransferase subunit A
MEQVGPLVKDAPSAALLLNVLAGWDERDAMSSQKVVPDYFASMENGVKGLRVGLSKGFTTDAAKRLEAAGAEIVEVDLPHSEYAEAAYFACATGELASNLARFDGVRYGFRAEGAEDVNDVYFKSRSQGFGFEAKKWIILGTAMTSKDFINDFYFRAMKVRTLIRRDFENAFAKCDALLANNFMPAVNLAGVCAWSMPGGLQIIGPAFGEETILKVGAVL